MEWCPSRDDGWGEFVCRLGLPLSTARSPIRLFHLVLESHDGRAEVPIPERSASPRATSTLPLVHSLKCLTPTGRLEKPTLDLSIDHLVSQRKEQVGYCAAEYGGLELDHQLNRRLQAFVLQ